MAGPQIEALKKVTLHLETGESPQQMGRRIDAPDFHFVFGIGRDGMSPFEYELLGKTAGDMLCRQIGRSEAHAYFEHLFAPLSRIFTQRERCWFRMTVAAVADASPREVVRAMAAAAEGGCDCGCGCSG